MVIVWRLRGNIIRAAPCWVVWHNVYSQQHNHVSSSYRSSRLGLSHWDPYAMHRGGCLELYYCNMVEQQSLGAELKLYCHVRTKGDKKLIPYLYLQFVRYHNLCQAKRNKGRFCMFKCTKIICMLGCAPNSMRKSLQHSVDIYLFWRWTPGTKSVATIAAAQLLFCLRVWR